MIKHCKCNVEKIDEDFCDHCGKPKKECICVKQKEGGCHLKK